MPSGLLPLPMQARLPVVALMGVSLLGERLLVDRLHMWLEVDGQDQVWLVWGTQLKILVATYWFSREQHSSRVFAADGFDETAVRLPHQFHCLLPACSCW